MGLRREVYDSLCGLARSARSCTDIHSTNVEDTNTEYLEASFSHLSLSVPVVKGDFEERDVLVWRLPMNISQSLLAGRRHSSNACTVISLKIVEYFQSNNILFPRLKLKSADGQSLFLLKWRSNPYLTTEFPCPGRIMNCMVNAIVEGNEIHEAAVARRADGRKNFTIPEALKAINNANYYEMDFRAVCGSIRENLPIFLTSAILCEALSSFDQLFFLLIVVEQCVMIVYQRTGDLLGFFDSHIHPPDGAVIACTTLENLDRFCCWLVNHVFPDAAFLDFSLQSFELSLICSRLFTPQDGEFSGRLTVDVRPRSTRLRALRKSIFPALTPNQEVTEKARQLAHRIVLERRIDRMRQYRQQQRHSRVISKGGAQMSASLPMLL